MRVRRRAKLDKAVPHREGAARRLWVALLHHRRRAHRPAVGREARLQPLRRGLEAEVLHEDGALPAAALLLLLLLSGGGTGRGGRGRSARLLRAGACGLQHAGGRPLEEEGHAWDGGGGGEPGAGQGGGSGRRRREEAGGGGGRRRREEAAGGGSGRRRRGWEERAAQLAVREGAEGALGLSDLDELDEAKRVAWEGRGARCEGGGRGLRGGGGRARPARAARGRAGRLDLG